MAPPDAVVVPRDETTTTRSATVAIDQIGIGDVGQAPAGGDHQGSIGKAEAGGGVDDQMHPFRSVGGGVII